MRIYLIGLPGVGKSTVGKKLASEIEFEYIDLSNGETLNKGETIGDRIPLQQTMDSLRQKTNRFGHPLRRASSRSGKHNLKLLLRVNLDESANNGGLADARAAGYD